MPGLFQEWGGDRYIWNVAKESTEKYKTQSDRKLEVRFCRTLDRFEDFGPTSPSSDGCQMVLSGRAI